MRRLLTMTLCAAAVACWSTTAQAASFQWDIAPQVGETVKIKLTNFEVILDESVNVDFDNPGTIRAATQAQVAESIGSNEAGDSLYGVFRVTSIENQLGTETFWQPSPGSQGLEGAFFDYRALEAPSNGTQRFEAGTTRVWFDADDDFDPTLGPLDAAWDGPANSNNVGEAGSTLMLEANGVQGVIDDPDTTLLADLDELSATRASGVGDGFLTIAFQEAFDGLLFDTNDPFDGATATPPTPGSQDLKLKSNFDTQLDDGTPVAESTGWTTKSEDPVNGVVVPEPSSWALLVCGGMGLLGWGGRRRRKTSDPDA